MKNIFYDLKSFFVLWITQSFSALGSAMTNFALVIWIYQKSGSALTTAMLAVCSYAPYVLISIFAGAVIDKWNKKIIMLVCDSFAAVCTIAIMILLKNNCLQIWHLYAINALNGLMNTIQQPASDVALTLLVPEKYYQKTSGMRSFSNSLVTVLTPAVASALMAFSGIEMVIIFDLVTFSTAFIVLMFFIEISEIKKENKKTENILLSVRNGILWLNKNKGILWLMLFLSAINFIASIYESALPAMILSKSNETALGAVNSCVGIATLMGSIIVTLMPEPENRVKIICRCLFFSMGTENFMLAFSENPVIWCIGAFCGWICIPLMNANMDVIFRTHIPSDIQGRIYSIRNTLQFFTIPLGYFMGGFLLDNVFEPFVSGFSSTQKGDGASLLFFVIGIVGVVVCFVFSRNRHIRKMK
ncbi:MAG: MFS transporter [Prevotella sp.]|nr:MFS transporter [Alistipes senegalensis]MCM1357726.1 MFS transporter [Prevotella sp.]MCM1474608.1 MFS transporter [Muribaculaceae bacterium]